jgi:cobalt-zinc-cadmium efflux system outer membrane protein
MGHRSRGVAAFAAASALIMLDAATARALTLDDALRRAHAADARLAAAQHETAAREAELRQAGARPNPTLSLDVENWGGTGDYGGFDLSETSLMLAQTFELGGKRAHRTNAAARDRDVAAAAMRAREAEVEAHVRHAFVDVLAFQEKARIAAELQAFAERSRTAVAERVRVGGTSPVEERRASVQSGALELERARIERELDAARIALAATWGDASPDFDEVFGSLDGGGEVPIDSLLAHIDEFPAVAIERARIERARAEVGAVRASGKLDLELAGGVRRLQQTEDFAALVSVGVPLPLADRKQAAAEAAQTRIAAYESELLAARRDVEARMRSLAIRIGAEETEARALDGDLLPEARRARDEAQAAYDQGLFRFTDVLDAERTLAELSTRAIDARVRALEMRAELGSIAGLVSISEETTP